MPSGPVRKPTFTLATGKRYIAIYKPYGMLSQFTVEVAGQHTLAELGLPKDVYPVGRLDQDSEGLLILTDDARLNSRLLDPEAGHKRIYLAQVERIPEATALQKLAAGVVLQGRKTLPCKVMPLAHEPVLPAGAPVRFRKSVPTSFVALALHEGKNRQVRKMTAAVGHPTLRLLRIAIGQLELFKLGIVPGGWIDLAVPQVQALFADADLVGVVSDLPTALP